MTNSEKLLSSFSENYFYKELVYADIKFIPIGGTEIELADLIINLEDIILAIQLKERNEKDRTQDKNIEEKWLKKKCKKAKEQLKDTISYITSEKVSFINARGKKTIINPSAEVVPLVVFENDSISKYEHLLRNHTNDGLAVNCMSIDDFKLMCKQLLSPIEIITKLKSVYKQRTGNTFEDTDYDSFGLVDENGNLTNAGALLADESPVRHSRLFCTRWNGLSKASGIVDALDDKEYTGSLVTLLQAGTDFIRNNSRKA